MATEYKGFVTLKQSVKSYKPPLRVPGYKDGTQARRRWWMIFDRVPSFVPNWLPDQGSNLGPAD